MISYENINEQNHKITELSNVLSVLIQDRLLCDSNTCSQLFYDYLHEVKDHIQEIDSNLYLDLLKHPSQEVNNIANNFMSGSKEIKRIMSRYEKKWCHSASNSLLVGAKHDKFLRETDEMFSMILKRIQDEMEHLYPLERKISQS